MNYEEYLFLIEKRLKKSLNFNIIKGIEEKGMKIDLFANSIFLSRNLIRNKILPFSKYEIYEKYYLKHYELITNKEIQEYFDFLHAVSNDFLPTYQHLQKCIIGIMVCNSIDEKYKSFINSLNYTKPFSIYLKGWSEIQLICVDLNKNIVYFNNSAKKSSELFTF